ncbi:MAG: hypothetical protein V1761_00480 [bacterium]
MPQAKKKPKPTQIEREIKAYNPTKSIVGKVIILILAAGFVIGLIISAIIGMIAVL